MEIGIKLDVGFSQHDTYRRLYGDRDILGFLRGAGVKTVEAPIGLATDERQVMEHVKQCSEASLNVSFHPYTERTPANPAFFSPSGDNACREIHERFMGLAAKAARLQRAETVINVHAAADSQKSSRDTLVDQSIRFFRWAREWCSAHALHVCPVAELQIRPNMEESIQRTGDDYAELLSIAEQSGVDVCWDLGHAFMNSRRFDVALDPPEALLRRVVRVHCHDVDREDHQPLLYGNVPWQRFLASLVKVGFDGTVLLEVPPENFLSAGGLDAVTHSIRVLRKWVQSHCGR